MKFGWNNLLHKFKHEWAVWWQYALLAIVVLLPTLLPGYILTLDMVFTPHMPWPTEVASTYPLDALLWLLGSVLPGDVVQKLVLLAIVTSAGVGMHLVVRQVFGLSSSETRHQPPDVVRSRSNGHKSARWRFQINPATQAAAYFAGIFYVINPFIYARLMAGQWLVLLGYALLPFLLRALFRLLAQPSRRNTIMAGLWAFVVTMASIHMSGVVVVLAALFLVAAAAKYWRQKVKLVQIVWRFVLAGGVALVLLSYWLVPTLLGDSRASDIAIQSGAAEFSAFVTHGGPLGPVGEVLRLQGFWAETRQLFVLPQDAMVLWGILVLLLWILVGIGAVRAWKTNKTVAVVMMGSIFAGVVLAVSPLMQWLAQIFPLLGGYREPHKFTVLVVLGYAVLGAYGVVWLVGKRRAKLWTAACLLLPLLITPTMLWGGGGQLRPVDYPAQWYTLNARLEETVRPGEQVLFLPWHMYAPYSFSNMRIIANPAQKFFEVPVIVGNDPEFAGIAPHQASETKRRIAELLKNPQQLAKNLADLNIRYVILAKEQSWQDYGFLKKLPLVYEDDKIILYEVKQ